MGYRAVALSNVDGTGGDSIGPRVAEALGFAYLNEAIIAQVAREMGVGEASVAQAERRKTLFDRIIEAAGRGAAMETAALVPWTDLVDNSDKLLGQIRDAVRDAAERGDVVLVAHAACYACADLPDVLRVSITAPISSRVERIAAAEGIDEKEAAKLLRQSDAGRSSYLKRVHDVGSESPTDYDLVINTDRLSPDESVRLLVELVRSS